MESRTKKNTEKSAWQGKRIGNQESNMIDEEILATDHVLILDITDSPSVVKETRPNELVKVEVTKSPLRARNADPALNPFSDKPHLNDKLDCPEQGLFGSASWSNQSEKYGARSNRQSEESSVNKIISPAELNKMRIQKAAPLISAADTVANRSNNRYALPTSSSYVGKQSEDPKTVSLYPVSRSTVRESDDSLWRNDYKSSETRNDEYSDSEQFSASGIIVTKRESSRTIDDITDRSEYGGKYNDTESVNTMYHKNRMSEPWLYAALIIHVIQFAVLLVLGHQALPTTAMAILVLFVVLVAALLVYSRKLVAKNRRRAGTVLFRKKIESKDERTPDEEADSIPQGAIYSLGAAAILEGCTFALYTVIMAGKDGVISHHNRQVILETLRFASITLLAFHRILRPANRVDPMRTMLEVNNCRISHELYHAIMLLYRLNFSPLSILRIFLYFVKNKSDVQ